MKWTLTLLIAALVGAVAGGALALRAASLIGTSAALSNANVRVDGWASDWSIGSAAATPEVRARIAVRGLLGLAKSEAVYFIRTTDDQGAPLREACTYEMSGGDQPAQWWSITLYDATSFMPRNDDGALSVDATRAIGDWSATISPTPPAEGLWISSRNAGSFDLTLRLYRPTDALLDAPEAHLNPPAIRRISCPEDAG